MARIPYVPFEQVDADMQAELERCAREGTPRPESQAVRAHLPAAFWSFADSWKALFHSGIVEHGLKDLCRVYISRTVKCEFCGNQRSEKASAAGLEEAQFDDLLNFETSDKYSEREKAALSYAQAIAWGLSGVDRDAFWDRLNANFNSAELVELGNMIALTFGQQSWLRLLDIEHHEYLAGTDASMAPGFKTADELSESKSREDYWAKV